MHKNISETIRVCSFENFWFTVVQIFMYPVLTVFSIVLYQQIISSEELLKTVNLLCQCDLRLHRLIHDVACPQASENNWANRLFLALRCFNLLMTCVFCRVAPNFGFGKFEIRPFFPNSASAKFLAKFGRRQCNCGAFS